jgi:type I restriction enzyme M protein
MDNKKEQERAALHTTIWRIANDLRGSVDGWDFKQYVLGMLFYRFISANITSYINEKQIEAGEKNFSYDKLKDTEAEYGRELILEEKGFFIHPSELFDNVRKQASSDTNLNEKLEKNYFEFDVEMKNEKVEQFIHILSISFKNNANIWPTLHGFRTRPKVPPRHRFSDHSSSF